MTVGASKVVTMITHKPALAPSPQPRSAPTARALPPELFAQRGPFWMPIRGPDPTPIDTPANASNIGYGVFKRPASASKTTAAAHMTKMAWKTVIECPFPKLRSDSADFTGPPHFPG